MRITISGTPGSGKSTVARLLARKLRCPYVNAGDTFRAEARRRGMTLAAFGAYVDAHPTIDRALDRKLLARAKRHRNLVLEGRLVGWLTHRARLPALRVWVTAREATRVSRLRRREGGTREVVRQQLRARARREAAQYRRLYRLDLTNLTPYDLIIRTDERTPEEVVRRIRNVIPTI